MIVFLKKRTGLENPVNTTVIFVAKSVDKRIGFTRKGFIQFKFEQLYQFTFFS